MQKLRIEIMSVSYQPLRLADMSICAVTVHRLLAQPVLLVLLCHDSKLVGRQLAAELVLGLHILNQPIDRPLKVLVLSQIDLVDLCGLHLLLPHLHAKEN
jgi:hypothetical protein